MSEFTIIIRQALLFVHVLLFALAMAEIIKEDLRLLFRRTIDAAALHATARSIKYLLLALWVSGILLIAADVGTDFYVILDRPKVLTKLIVVSALTLNGVLLHYIAFPMLTERTHSAYTAATVSAVLGAISTTSWLYASFVGVARIVAPLLTLQQFLTLYVIALCFALIVAIVFVRDRVELMLLNSHGPVDDAEHMPEHFAHEEMQKAIAMLQSLNHQLKTRNARRRWQDPGLSARRSATYEDKRQLA